ncbi:MAG: hypothetical protein J6336_10555 [Kiritimatiellae bacterium]|nr:hypothetical protein [Kiritimatiellia bacterium]
MKRVVMLAVLIAGTWARAAMPAGFTDDLDAALAAAGDQPQKTVLALFTGSDWCAMGRRLEREVLSDREFLRQAEQRFICVYMDSPNDISLLSEPARIGNPKWVERYAIADYPTVLLLDPAGKILARTGYRPGGAEAYLRHLSELLERAPLVTRYLTPYREEFDALRKTSDTFMRDTESRSKRAKEALRFRSQAKEIRKRFRAEKVPEPLAVEAEAFLEEMLAFIRDLRLLNENGGYPPPKPEGEPVLVPPQPEDANVETAYCRDVALPFWRRQIVETFHPPAEISADVSNRIARIREALALRLATGYPEFPTGRDLNDAEELWDKKCRDAGVTLAYYLNQDNFSWYRKGTQIHKEGIAAHDDAAEPMLGFLLRRSAALDARARYEYDTNQTKVMSESEPIFREYAAAFARVAPIFKAADRRIAENLDVMGMLPSEAPALLENPYLGLCKKAAVCREDAFLARGRGWSKDVTQEGWIGWEKKNAETEKYLLEAVRMRPGAARPAMMLADLYGRWGGRGDAFYWFNRGVSNSLDQAVPFLIDVLKHQTTRWGGSRDILYGVATQAVSSVRTDSTFAYRTAACALDRIFIYEVEHLPQTNLVNRIVKTETAEAFYRMFDAYAAAGEQPFMPSPDHFRGMGLAFAMQRGEWGKAREYVRGMGQPLIFKHDAYWLNLRVPRQEYFHIGSPRPDYLHTVNLFVAIGQNRHREALFAAEEVAGRNQHEAALAQYEKLLKENLSWEERNVVSRHLFLERLRFQESAGGWVDVMPTQRGSEAWSLGAFVQIGSDGWARPDRKTDCFRYRTEIPLPWRNVEYEATVHFERKDPDQKVWTIGWGLGRWNLGTKQIWYGQSWAFPYVHFRRDAKGDHVAIESMNPANYKTNGGSVANDGTCAEYTVYKGDLASSDTHTFSLKTTHDAFIFTVDGQRVLTIPTEEIITFTPYRQRLNPYDNTFPVWKLSTNTAFSAYRYRRITP